MPKTVGAYELNFLPRCNHERMILSFVLWHERVLF